MSAAMFRALCEALIFVGAVGVIFSGFMLIREQQERRSQLRRRRGNR